MDPVTGYRTAKNIFKTVSSVLDIIKNADSITDLRIPEDKLTLLEANGSAIKLLTPYIIEPSVIITNTLKDVKETEKVINLSVDMFTAFYTQVFNVLVNVHGMDGKVVFDLLSSKRHFGVESNNSIDLIMSDSLDILPLSNEPWLPSNESKRDKGYEQKKSWKDLDEKERTLLRNDILVLSIKDIKKKQRKGKSLTHEEETILELSKRGRDKKTSDQITQTIKNNIQAKANKGYELTKAEKLILDNKDSKDEVIEAPRDRKIRAKSVGKNKSFESPSMLHKEIDISYEVQTKSGVYTVEIPIIIKANIVYTDFINITNVLDNNSDRKGFFSRLEEYRSGGISLSDLILAKDLIDEYRQSRFKDKDEILKDIENRSTSANLSIFSKGAVGLDKFYGIVIVSKYEQTQIERLIRGSLDKERYRDVFLRNMRSMMLLTIDTDWEMIKIYIKEIRGTSTLSFNSLGGAKKETDMTEIFKALVSNKPPF